jgi:WD40 repeat protein/uncharacterized caspase-like protein/cytochrome c-type biogenesis protein CcmH/NrfG
MKYLTLTLVAVLLACGSLFSQKPGRQTPSPRNKGSEALIDAGDKLVDDRKWSEAVDAYLQATRVDPQNADAYVRLGDAYMGAAKWAEALVAYKKAVALNPQSADAQYALGDAYNTMRMHGDAFAPLVKATQLDPTFAEAFYGIGYAYLAGKQYAKSLSFLNSAIRLKPDYEDAHYGLAVAHLNLGNQKELDDERKRLVRLNSALVKKLDSDIDKFKLTASEGLALSGAAPSPADAAPAPEPTPQRTPPPAPSARTSVITPNDSSSFERAFWESIKDSKDQEDFNYYLRKYPNGEFAALARIRSRQGKAKVPIVTPSATSPVATAPKPTAASNQNVSGQRPELAIVTGHSAPMSALAFSQDGAILATGDGGGAIKVWDAQSGEGLRTIVEGESLGAEIRANSPVRDAPTVNSLAFSYDGRLLAGALYRMPDKEKDPNAKPETEIAIWDVASGSLLGKLSGITIDVQAIAFSPTGKWLASGGLSNVVTLWDVRTGTDVKSFTGQASLINFVMFNNETEVQSGSWDRLVDVWNPVSGAPLRVIQGSPVLGPTGASGSSFSYKTVFNSVTRRFASINAGFSGEHKDLSEPAIILREGSTTRALGDFRHAYENPNVIAFTPSGRILAGGSNNGSVELWNVDSGRKLLTIKEGFSSENIAMSPDSTTIAQLTADEKSIKLWDTNNQTTMEELSGHTDDISTLVFSPDSQTLASGSADKTIRLWDLKGGGVKILTGHASAVGAVAFHPTGKLLASIPANDLIQGDADDEVVLGDTIIKLWDVATGKEVGTVPDPSVPLSLVFSPDGLLLAVGNRDGTIWLLDLSGKTAPRTLPAKNDQVVSMVFVDPDTLQSLGMAADESSMVANLWRVSSGQLLKSNRVNPSDPSSYKEKFAMGSMPFVALSRAFYAMPVKGNSLTLFSRTSGEIDPSSQPELATLYLLDDNDWLVTTPDGLFDGSPGAWPRAIWRFDNNTLKHAPVEAFFKEFYYPGLLSDILAGKRPQAPSDMKLKDIRQPQLRIGLAETNPNATLTTRDVRLTIDISQAAAGAQDVRFFRNGTLVKVWHGDVLKGQSSVTLEATIPIVAGENKLTAYAFNHDDVKSTDARLTITGGDSLKRKGVAYVLAVGVNEYAAAQLNLKYAVADAQGFATEVRVQQAKLNTYDRVEVIPLNDRDATKANILKSLTDLATKVQPEDAVLIYFAGHGTAEQNRFYLIPHDFGTAGASMQDILTHGISDEELERAVESIDAGQMLLVIDACNSGQALESEDKRRGPMNSKGLAQFGYDKGMYILTAAQSYQAANEAARLGHGFLTYALVEEGLKTDAADGSPRDGRVVLREWLDYATRRVPQMQQDELDAQQKQGRQLDRIKFAEADTGKERSIQRPRVFYRREIESHPLVVSSNGNIAVTEDSLIKTATRKGAIRARSAIENSNTKPAYGGPEPLPSNITPETIEGKYQRGLLDEVIGDSRRFLSGQPDNAKVNTILGFVLLSQQKDSEAFVYLDKGFLGGEPITTNVRRHRLLGPLLQDGSIEMTVKGLVMKYGTESYSAPFSAISSFDARSYGQSGAGIFIRGKFLNQNGKEEKKEFKLFATTATIGQVRNGLGTVPIVYCQNCEAWSLFIVKLFSHLMTVSTATGGKVNTSAILSGQEADTLNTCIQGAPRTPAIVKAIAEACGITPS